MAIQAIETRYAGCRFRSRLEARWAVFFDHMGIKWEYEPQGFEVGFYERSTRYLPDFWLSDLRLWVEVKGELTEEEAEKLCWAACPHWGLPADPEGTPVSDQSRCGWRMLILGSIPRNVGPHGSGLLPGHRVLNFHKGDLTAERASFYVANSSNSPGPWSQPCILPSMQAGPLVWNDASGLDELVGWTDDDHRAPLYTKRDRWIDLTDAGLIDVGWILGDPSDCKAVRIAYGAARSARFEHGEAG